MIETTLGMLLVAALCASVVFVLLRRRSKNRRTDNAAHQRRNDHRLTALLRIVVVDHSSKLTPDTCSVLSKGNSHSCCINASPAPAARAAPNPLRAWC